MASCFSPPEQQNFSPTRLHERETGFSTELLPERGLVKEDSRPKPVAGAQFPFRRRPFSSGEPCDLTKVVQPRAALKSCYALRD